MAIHWEGDGVLSYEADFGGLSGGTGSETVADGEILVTAGGLTHGDRLGLRVNYPGGYFPDLDPEQSAEQADRGVVTGVVLVAAVFLLLLGVALFSAYRSRRDPDYWDRRL